MKQKLSIIIPFYNEKDNIPKLRQELFPVIRGLLEQYEVEVVFVDDGSRDGSLDALRSEVEAGGIPGMAVIFRQHDRNRGLGAALKTGFAAAGGDIIVTTDSDGTYQFSNIPAMIEYLKDADIVTASPYHPEGDVVGVPGYRLLLSRGSSLIYRFLVDWRIHTYTCLFRAYRREVIDRISFQSDGFLAGTELMVKGMLKGYQVREFPAVLYRRVFGVSKAKLLRTIWAHLKFQGQVLLYRMKLKPI